MYKSKARVTTAHASRYLQQLCKHWSHRLAVDFTPAEGSVTFPKDARGAEWPGDAVLSMTADSETLVCEISASAPAQLEGLKVVVEEHLNRFAFREGSLTFDWKAAEPA